MKALLFVLLMVAKHVDSHAQGCVAIRSNGASCSMSVHQDMSSTPAHWLLGINNRYFKSYRHFVGDQEQKHRVEEGSEVINYFFSTEVGLTRIFNSRWSAGVYVPVIHNIRSSKYEHYGNNSINPNARRQTSSFGIGDTRLAVYYWLLHPEKAAQGNIQLGTGLKLATGDYRYTGFFWKNDSTRVHGPVDQSIQLGDGGTGVTLEINSYYRAARHLNLYFNGFYLVNPREHNGVSTARGGTPSAAQIAYGSDVMSVPDQYMLRIGGSMMMNRFTVSAGARVEGIPAEDLVGGSNGFRRPGYVVAIEPVLAYSGKSAQIYLSVPYAVERNRTQSVPDQIRTEKTQSYFKGDAAFADYSVNVGVSFRL